MIYPSLVTTALLAVWGTAAYMSISGLISIFGNQPIVAGCLAAGMELGKLLAVIHLHRNWRTTRWTVRVFYAIIIGALVSITAIEAAGYLIQSHSSGTAAITINRTRLASLSEAEQHLRRQIDTIDGNLEQLPDGYVSRRINERKAAGYDALQRQLTENLARQQTLAVAIATAETTAGPIAALSGMIDTSHRTILLAFVIIIVSIMEPLSIGLAVAASIAWQSRQPGIAIATAGQTAMTAETIKAAVQNGQKRPTAGQPATATAKTAKENGHAATPINKDFAKIIARHNLKKQDIADITGRKQLETIDSWLDGNQEIPVKALRALRKWSDGRPAVRLVKRPTGTGGIADATPE